MLSTPNHRRLSLGLACAIVAATAALATAQERFTAHHVARTRSVTEAAVAPDGQQVAYVLSVPRIPFEEDDGPAWGELHVVGPDGRSRPFVTGAVNVSGIKWTAGGRAVAFLAKRGADETRSLYIMPADGGEARRVLKHETDIVAFDLSADGRQIAFISRRAPPSERQELAKKGFNQEIFEETLLSQRVFLADARNDGPPESPRAIDLPGSASAVAWSPDGAKLLVIQAPTALVDDDLMNRRVLIFDAAAGTLAVKIENPGKLGHVAWSPDGRFVGMISAEDLNDPAQGRLMVVPAIGGPLRDLLPGYEGHVAAFAWKDADTLVFAGDEGTGSTYGEVGRDGANRRTLIPGGGPILTALDRAKSGAVAFVADTPQHPSEVYLLAAEASTAKRLTDSNPWLKEMRLAKQEVVTFKARDGLELQGVLLRPLDEQPGRRYPLILTVHGGPESRDAHGWKTSYANPGQVAAAQGFAVFYPNYRGSTGRGVAFSKLSQGDPAGKEFDDLVDAVDHLVQIGLVDRSKVGITGGSYGGYASAWGATYYSERFAASVMFVGISDKTSKVGTTDIANEEYLVHARKRPWDNWQFFLERSPIYHAGKSRTPTLILHGTADPRVHPTQSLELYRYLKLHGKAPVRLVWYPGEGHGNRRAASRLDFNLRLMRWMSHYLQGPGGAMPPHEIDYKGALRRESTQAGK
ncbi:MAG TPA: S9 family peptidase [Vicinamibacterales bacterium]|nr:S9 family peptidase [Vicinamibacterales bacterium]